MVWLTSAPSFLCIYSIRLNYTGSSKPPPWGVKRVGVTWTKEGKKCRGELRSSISLYCSSVSALVPPATMLCFVSVFRVLSVAGLFLFLSLSLSLPLATSLCVLFVLRVKVFFLLSPPLAFSWLTCKEKCWQHELLLWGLMWVTCLPLASKQTLQP